MSKSDGSSSLDEPEVSLGFSSWSSSWKPSWFSAMSSSCSSTEYSPLSSSSSLFEMPCFFGYRRLCRFFFTFANRLDRGFCHTPLNVSGFRFLIDRSRPPWIVCINLVFFLCASCPDFLAFDGETMERIDGCLSDVTVLEADQHLFNFVRLVDNIFKSQIKACILKAPDETHSIDDSGEDGSVDFVGTERHGDCFIELIIYLTGGDCKLTFCFV